MTQAEHEDSETNSVQARESETSDWTGACCKNCAAPLSGPWCARCGQKHLAGPPTVGLFLEELISAITHADSRFWRTLWALVAKPGFLAREFFDGRRARYLPPLRLYLGISLVFFLYLSADAQLNPAGYRDATEVKEDPFVTIGDSAKKRLSQLQEEGDIADPKVAEKIERLSEQIKSGTLSEFDEDPCASGYSGEYEEWLQPRFESACRQLQQDGGYALAQSFMSKLPTAMFLLMPLFAISMKLWYWRPKRYFTEHLVLQINNHSAIFLFVLGANLLSSLAGNVVGGWVYLLTAGYIFVYSYRSLGVYYGQSKWLTRFKYLSLMVVYEALLGMVLAFTGVASLFSVLGVS